MELFGLYAALCTPAVELSSQDAERLVEGLIYAQNGAVFHAVQTKEEKEKMAFFRKILVPMESFCLNFTLHFEDPLVDKVHNISLSQQLCPLTVAPRMANSVAARKIGEVLEFAKTSNSFLTKVASAALEHLPQTLQWEQVGNSPCFHARDQGCLYSINLLNGKVLQDGYPPRRVPASIMEHELYCAALMMRVLRLDIFWGTK